MGTLPHLGHTKTVLSVSPAQKSLRTPGQSPAAFWTLGRCTAVSLLPSPLPPHFTFSSHQVYFVPLLSSAHMTFPLGLKSHSFSLTPTQ